MYSTLTRRANGALPGSIAVILSLSLVVPKARAQAGVVGAQEMRITRRAEQPAGPGPAANFTGTVRVTRLFDATPPSRVAGALVTSSLAI